MKTCVQETGGQYTVSRVYHQLQQSFGKNLSPAHYTLIELATKTRAVAQPYFELDPGTMRLSEEGIERFGALCVAGAGPANKPLHNPELFRQFVEVVKDGEGFEAGLVVSGEWTLDEAVQHVRFQKTQGAFLAALEELLERAGSLRPDDYRGTVAEAQAVRRLDRLVRTRLLPLIENHS